MTEASAVNPTYSNIDKLIKDDDRSEVFSVEILLTSTNLPVVQELGKTIVDRAAQFANTRVEGPYGMKPIILRHTTRKTPCGEGSKTWDRFQMRIYRRRVCFVATSAKVKEISDISIPSFVTVDVSFSPREE